MNQLEQVIQHLRLLSTGLYTPTEVDCGLCRELYYECNKFILMHRIDFNKWEYYSGDINYPIPDPKGIRSANWMYIYSDNLWDNSDYADLRREFCLWCAEQLENNYGY